MFFLLYTFACNHKKEKEFAGEILYTYTYESSTLNIDSLARVRPSKGIFRYDRNNYQSSFIGRDTITYYYSGSVNKCVTEASGHDYECEDYGIATDSVLSWKLYPSDVKVLGQQCEILELQKRNSLVKYYVSKELKIAPSTYQKHKAYNWDFYGEKAKAGLILKLEHRFRSFTMKGVATSMKMSEGEFVAFQKSEEKLFESCNTKK